MRYSTIRKMDISNGPNVGVSLFVQGCRFHCFNCFNKSTWDFNGGKEFTKEVQEEFFEVANKDHIKRITLLGGEPLADENVMGIYDLLCDIKTDKRVSHKKIWLYSGYTLEEILLKGFFNENIETNFLYRYYILSMCDILVDGLYIDNLKNYKLKYRGSSNQRVIDLPKTLKKIKDINKDHSKSKEELISIIKNSIYTYDE